MLNISEIMNQCFECKKNIDINLDFLCPHCGTLPIQQNIYESMVEMSTLVGKLNIKLNNLRNYFKTLGLHSSDERNQTLGALSFLFMWLNQQLIAYSEFSRNQNDPLIQKILKENPDISQQTFDVMTATFDAINRRSFLTEMMFIVEVFLESVNKILKTKTLDYGYKNLVKHVLKELDMSKPDDELYRMLYFPAIIRNSMHMSGIHTQNDNNGKIDGIPFKFEKDTIPQYGSWRNIYFFSDKILVALEQILKNKLIEKTPIPTMKLGI